MEWERQRAYDRQAGLEAGQRNARIESAENLIKMNIGTLEQISEATGLSLEEVEELAKKINVTA